MIIVLPQCFRRPLLIHLIFVLHSSNTNENCLMPYAFSHVLKQYHFAEKVKVVAEHLDSSTTTFYSKERAIHTSQDHCDCVFFKAMSLPCRHIFTLYQYLKADLFGNQLCVLLWTCDYFQKSHRVFCSHPTQVPDVTVNTINSSKILSQQKKYCKVYSIAQKLADIGHQY